jgi:hypothetical protein
MGLRVFPCHVPIEPKRVGFGSNVLLYCSCERASCTQIGKHPATSDGFRSATCKIAQVRALWQALPTRNIAIRTGEGLLVVDVDPRNQGDSTLRELQKKFKPLDAGARVITGGGGEHYYFRYDPKIILSGASNLLGKGVDVKANNAYVIAPTSLHKSGKSYTWASGRIPKSLPIAPYWVIKLIAERSALVLDDKQRSAASGIKTAGHKTGQAIAKLIGAKDRGTYWKFACPARAHTTPDAAMYPYVSNRVVFVCFSSNPCSDAQIRAVIEAKRV